eukprot:5355531-Prymnesium_polylepis.1
MVTGGKITPMRRNLSLVSVQHVYTSVARCSGDLFCLRNLFLSVKVKLDACETLPGRVPHRTR